MGYSMATPIKNEKLKQKMLQFLKNNWRNWPTIIGRPDEGQYLSDPKGGNLSYDHGKCRIGFNFNASESERTYGWCMCAWMAIKIGRRMNYEGSKIPFFYYDGHERILVIIGSYDKDKKDGHSRYDDLGVVHLNEHDLCYTNKKDLGVWRMALSFLKDIENERKRERKIIRYEIERLNSLWEKEND